MATTSSSSGGAVEDRRRKEAMDALISDIIHNDDENISISIREAFERGLSFKFGDCLRDANKRKEAEIDRICSRHYSDFLMSVRELLKMEDQSDNLREVIEEIHRNFETTGEDLVTVLKDLETLEMQREKTARVLEAILVCKEITKTMVLAKQQFHPELKEGVDVTNPYSEDSSKDSRGVVDYYAAMRSIELIKSEQAKISHLAPMQRFVSDWIATHTSKLLGMVKHESDACVFRMRGAAELLGATVLRKQARLSTQGRPRKHGRPVSISLQHIESYSQLFRLDRWTAGTEFDDLLPENFLLEPSLEGQLLLDSLFRELSPLLRSLYMHYALGAGASFHSDYRKVRDDALLACTRGAEKDAEQFGAFSVFPKLLASLAGFFAYESMVGRVVEVKEYAFSQEDMTALWERACSSISRIVTRWTSSSMTILPHMLLVMREDLLLLVEAVSDDLYSLRTFDLLEVMKDLWERLERVAIEAVLRVCNSCLESSSFQPFFVCEEAVFASRVRAYHLDSLHIDAGAATPLAREAAAVSMATAAANLDALEEELVSGSIGLDTSVDRRRRLMSEASAMGISVKKQFTAQSYPFSEAVPVILHEMHVFVMWFVIFSVKNPHLGSRGQALCTAVQRAFEQICHSFSQKLAEGRDTPLSKTVQIAVDATTLAYAGDTLWVLIEKALRHFHWADGIDSDLTKKMQLYLRQCLLTVSSQAQDLIFENLALKIDDLLASLEFINYTPTSVPHTHHELIQELTDFLQVTFMCLAPLPASAREACHFACCSRISATMKEFLFSEKVVQINALAVCALDLDIRSLELFADGCGTAQLRLCFLELKELVKCFLHPDLATLDAKKLRLLFPRLDPDRLASLLEKTAPTPACSNKYIPKMTRSTTRAVIKVLRQAS